MTNPSSFDPTPFVVVWVLFLLVGLGVYAWYAFMLSKVFTRLGAEGWKAWVPLYNEAEIFRLGGVPAWSVVFYLLPVVQFYALYLKAVAASRLGAHFGHGTGTTVLAILLPPVWATTLAGGGRPADPALQERIAPSVAERSGYAFAVSPDQPQVPPPPAPQPAAPPPAAPLPPAGGVPFVPVAPTAATPPPAPVPPTLSLPPVAPPLPLAPPVVAAPVAPPAAPPAAPPPIAPPVAPPTPAATPAAPPAATPAAPPAAPTPPVAPSGVLPPPPGAAVAPTPIVPPPGLLITPPPVVPAEKHAPSMPAQPWAPLDRPTPPAAATPAPASPVLDPDAEGDELDRTVVVDRRPVATWSLVVDDGPTLRLSGLRVVLGRRPAGSGDGAQELAVPDATRTLSKVHARLDLADGVWTVTDLNATNGVIVIGADGSETLLDPGASAPVGERFILGKVGMRLVVAEGDAAR